MKSNKSGIYCLLSRLLVTGISGAFTPAPNTVIVDLNSSSIIRANLLFDESFYLTGKASNNCVKINFS